MSAIDAYLHDLDAALTVASRRLRRRILAEAEDHLRCAADSRGELEAVAAFGPPGLVANRFAVQLAHAGAARATWAGAAVVALFAALAAAGPPGDAIPWFAAQIALTCTALSAIRVWRHRRDDAVPAAKLRLVNRGIAVALGAVLVASAAAVAAGTQVTGAALVGVAAVASLAVLGRAVRRLRAVAAAGDLGFDDAFDDVLALAAPVLVRLPAGDLAGRLAAAARARPWAFCLLVAGAAGAALAVAHGVGEPPGALVPGLAAGAVLLAVEGATVVVCFALLGRFLGIRARA